MQTSVY